MQLTSPFVEKRIKRCGELFYKRIIERETICIKCLSTNSAEKKRFERWVRNPEVTQRRIINTEQARLSELVAGRHVLAVQDTTEINYRSKVGRSHGLGIVGNGIDAGFFMHPMIAFDAITGSALGCAEATLWNRTKQAAPNHHKLPIEEKESYRWISTATKSKQVLSSADCVTFLGDRENDIYEYLDRLPDERSHVLVRVRTDRILKSSEHYKLYEHLESTEEAGQIKIDVQGDARINRKKRQALLSIKWSEVELKKPKNSSDKSASKSIKMRVVEVKELNCPEGQEPILWRLYTTHQVNSFSDAKQIIFWYQMRWNIEQVFRVLKSQGLNIEESQVESGANLMKLAILAVCAAIQTMQLVSARDGSTELKTCDQFTKDERFCLEALLTTVEGKTVKQQNPHPKENLAWASWIIARLGGWHCYTKSEGPPGPIVMGRGLKKFYQMFDGWILSRLVSTE